MELYKVVQWEKIKMTVKECVLTKDFSFPDKDNPSNFLQALCLIVCHDALRIQM